MRGPLINGRGDSYVLPSEKVCGGCFQTKPLDGFHRRNGRAGGRVSRCKECIRVVNIGRTRVGYTKPTADQTRESNLRRYGITTEIFEHMLAEQGHGCAVCAGPAMGKGRYHVDHCHKTGRVRGLLCHKCNVALGMVGDDVDHLRALIRYLGELT